MENEEMKQCPYCAEPIRKNAIKCRYCGSMLESKNVRLDFLSTPGYWHRVREGKKVAGVCTGIAKQLESPVLILPLRLFFILTSVFYFFGPILYVVLWVLMPPPTDKSGASRAPKSPRARASSASPPPRAFDLDVNGDNAAPVDVDSIPENDGVVKNNGEIALNDDDAVSTVEAPVSEEVPPSDEDKTKEQSDWEAYGPKQGGKAVETISLDDDEDDTSAGNGDADTMPGESDGTDGDEETTPEAGEKRDDGTAKMIGMKKGFASIGLVVLVLITGYLIVLNGMLHITISPFFLIAGLMLAAAPLVGTLFALRLNLIKTVSTGI